MEKLLSPSALVMDWWRSSCSLVDVMASDSELVATKEAKSLRIVSSISGLNVASLESSTKCSIMGTLSKGASKTLWETAFRVFWSSIGVSSKNVQHCLQKVR
jgi:hypothetical protein